MHCHFHHLNGFHSGIPAYRGCPGILAAKFSAAVFLGHNGAIEIGFIIIIVIIIK